MATVIAKKAPAPTVAVVAPDAEPVPEDSGGGDQRAIFQQGVDALTVADQSDFASPEYTAGVQASLPFFQEAASMEGELTEIAAETVQTLQEYLAVDWGTNPETRGDDEAAPDEEEALVASGAPVNPPAAWMDDPKLTGPTGLTVTPEGRIFGHLATFDACHIAAPSGADICVLAPHSNRGYADFHTGAVRTAEGTLVPTGRITMDTGHAPGGANALRALAHYDNTGYAVADVRAGEDEFGIWVAGALRPQVSPKQLRALQGSPLSGDWRTIGGSLELVAALAVNVPGFGVPRVSGLVASLNARDAEWDPEGAELVSLVAAGMIAPEAPARQLTAAEQMEQDARYLHKIAEKERRAERQELRSRVNKSKVASFAAKRKG